MEPTIEQQREAKQAYLRDAIDVDYYEEFAEFCQEQTGTIDIDTWKLEFIEELVNKFKESLNQNHQEQGQTQRSFAMYQTQSGEVPPNPPDEKPQSTVLEGIQHTDQPVEPNQGPSMQKQMVIEYEEQQKQQVDVNYEDESGGRMEEEKVDEDEMPSPTLGRIDQQSNEHEEMEKGIQEKNRVNEMLDSAFDHAESSKISKIPEKNEEFSFSKEFFNSENFWQVPKLNTTAREKTPSEIPISQIPTESKIKDESEKEKESDISAFNYNDASGFQYFNTAIPVSKNLKKFDEFNVFDAMTEEEIVKNKQGTQSKILKSTTETQSKPKPKSKIRVKEIKTLSQQQSKESKKSEGGFCVPKVRKIESSRNTQTVDRHSISQISTFSKNQFKDQVSCFKSAARPFLNEKGLAMKVVGHEIRERSIFASNYIMYHFKIFPSQAICKRNFEDFSRLKNILKNLYPGLQLPFLEKNWLSHTNENFADRQGEMLELFMADILNHEELRNSRVVEDFLTITDHKKMKRKIEEFEKMAKPKGIQQLCLLQGNVQVRLQKSERKYKQQSEKFLTKTQWNLDKLRKLCQALSLQYDQQMTTVRNICEVVREMSNDTQRLNLENSDKQIPELEESLQKMRNGFKQNYGRLQFEKAIIDVDILPFIRYEKENARASREIIETANTFSARYLKRVGTEGPVKGSDSYLGKKLKDFKQGVDIESKNLTVLKYQTAYWQVQACEETNRILRSLGDKVKKRWSDIGTKCLGQLSTSVHLWSMVA